MRESHWAPACAGATVRNFEAEREDFSSAQFRMPQ
jgi:hypothetical protein